MRESNIMNYANLNKPYGATPIEEKNEIIRNLCYVAHRRGLEAG